MRPQHHFRVRCEQKGSSTLPRMLLVPCGVNSGRKGFRITSQHHPQQRAVQILQVCLQVAALDAIQLAPRLQMYWYKATSPYFRPRPSPILVAPSTRTTSPNTADDHPCLIARVGGHLDQAAMPPSQRSRAVRLQMASRGCSDGDMARCTPADKKTEQ